MTPPAGWHKEAQRMAAQGRTTREIAERFGVSASATWKATHPERAAEMVRRDNARRRPAKRKWDIGYDERTRDVCRCCSGDMSRGSGRPSDIARREGVEDWQSGLCLDCRNAMSEARLSVIAGLYNEGWPLREIAQVLGRVGADRPGGGKTIGPEIDSLRKRGLIGHRYAVTQSLEAA